MSNVIKYPRGFRLTASGVVVGTYGNASTVPAFTVNQYGIITSATNTPISISYTQVPDFNSGVDVWSQGFPYKYPVRVCSTQNVDINSVSAIDSITLNEQDRVLLVYQSDKKENGIYFFEGGKLTRALDADSHFELCGVFVTVKEGTLFGATAWHLSYNGADFVPGEVDLYFTKVTADKNVYKMPCDVATVSNETIPGGLAAGLAIDGYTLELGDRVLVRAQTTLRENGIYIVTDTGGVPDHDWQTYSEGLGALVFVKNGDTYQDTWWFCSDFAGNFGSDDVTFTQFGGGTPAGADTSIQFNDGGAFGGESTFSFDKVTNTVTLGVEAGLGTFTGPAATLGGTAGGSLQIQAGDGAASGGGVGGSLTIKAGDALSGNDDGGNFYLTPGAKDGAGNDGQVYIEDPTSNNSAVFNTSLLTADQGFTFPDATGTLVLSVNGSTPDSAGNVTVSSTGGISLGLANMVTLGATL